MDGREVRAVVDGVARPYGLARRGRRWVLDAPEVTWTLSLDWVPFRRRFGLELDLALAALADDDGPDAGIPAVGLHQYHFEDLAGLDGVALGKASDMDHPLPDDERRTVIADLTRAMCEYAAARTTLAAVTTAYGASEYRASFVYWKARALFEA